MVSELIERFYALLSAIVAIVNSGSYSGLRAVVAAYERVWADLVFYGIDPVALYNAVASR